MNSLCDTNSVSELMKPEPHPKVEEWFSRQDFIFISVVTIEEIYYGLSYKNFSFPRACVGMQSRRASVVA
jgi:predicted nucleic acid-binding protein